MLLGSVLTENQVGSLARHGGGEEKTVTIKTVDRDDLTVCFDAWQIVGKCRTDTHTGFNDLGLTKGRMEGMGGAQQLHHGTRRHRSGALAFNHRRSDHETVIGARHGIKRKAWMKQTDRPRQRDIRRAKDQHFAANTAQPVIGRCHSHAVYLTGETRNRPGVAAEVEFDTHGRKLVMKCRHRLAWVEVSLVGEEQSTPEAAGEVGFQERNFVFIDAPMP